MAKKDLEEEINKQYGEGTLFRLRSKSKVKYNEELFMSSGSYELNRILSGNHRYGMRSGRIMELFGPEGSGKTTIALHFAAEATKRKINTVFMDLEHALDDDYALSLGINKEYFEILQPFCAEDTFDLTWKLLEEGRRFFIYDSVPSMVPRAEIEGDMDEAQMGAHARVMGKGLRKASKLYSKRDAWAIFINQIRIRIGVTWGDPETTPGGKALKFFSSYRLDVRSNRGDKIQESMKIKTVDEFADDGEKDEDNKKKKKSEQIEVGTRMTVKTTKNKISPPFQKTKIKIVYGEGIDRFDDLLQFLDFKGIIELKGASGKKIGYKGKNYLRKKFQLMLKEKEFKNTIKMEIKKSYEN